MPQQGMASNITSYPDDNSRTVEEMFGYLNAPEQEDEMSPDLPQFFHSESSLKVYKAAPFDTVENQPSTEPVLEPLTSESRVENVVRHSDIKHSPYNRLSPLERSQRLCITPGKFKIQSMSVERRPERAPLAVMSMMPRSDRDHLKNLIKVEPGIKQESTIKQEPIENYGVPSGAIKLEELTEFLRKPEENLYETKSDPIPDPGEVHGEEDECILADRCVPQVHELVDGSGEPDKQEDIIR